MSRMAGDVDTGGTLPPDALQRAAKGNETAVADFIRAYWPRVHRVAALIAGTEADGDDVAQDAMLRAVQGLPSLDLSCPIEPWIDRVAANAARDWLRKRRRRNETPVEDAPDIVATEWAEDLDGVVPSGLIRDVLMSLSDLQRAVVVMRHLLEMRATEVAAVLELPEGTVRSLDHRALKSMRDQLEREEIGNA